MDVCDIFRTNVLEIDRSGMGVIKPVFSVPSFSQFFWMIKTLVAWMISRSYLAGVTAAYMSPLSKLWLPLESHVHMMTSSNGNIFRVIGPLCGNSPITGEFPAQRPVTRSFDVFFDLRLNKRMSKQSWGWWFETPSLSLWRHSNDIWHVLPQPSCCDIHQIWKWLK